MRLIRLSMAVLALLCVTAAAGAQGGRTGDEAAATSFSVDDAIDLTRVSDPQLSPDGTRVLFTRSTLDWEENERDSRIWIADADGSEARPFTAEEGDSDPRWSPDGRWIAFVRSAGEGDEGDEERRQLFLLRSDGGEARQLTSHPTSIGDFEWTPDSRRLVFVAEDSLSKAVREAREKGADAFRVDEGPNGQGRGQWSNLWWVAADPDSAEAQPVTEGDRIVSDFAVSPDGRRVAFTFRTEDYRNGRHLSELAVVDLATGAVTPLTENAAPESDLAWAPDGRTLTFMAPDLEVWRLDQGNLYAMAVATGAVRQLAPEFAGEISSYAWAPDGRAIDLVALERTVANVYRLDVASGEVRRLSEFGGIVSSPSFSRGHGRIAFELSSPTQPGDIYVADREELGDGEPVRLTDANPWIRTRTLATPEVVRWTSTDGLAIEGLLYRPAGDPNSPGAFVLEIHGGPAGVFTRGFDSDAQILAAYGYAVLQPNVRGSSGYGDALLRGNMQDIGGGDFQDLMTGVDAMIERGVAHPDSLAVKGWSYGGILGGWTLTRTDRFRAASLGAMVADWRSEFGAGFNFDVSRWYLGGDPWSNREFWIERSSFTYLDQVTTPTILFHGERDRTDTIQQTMNFHEGLRYLGVPTRFVRFPREGHGIREPRHHRLRLIEELRWFQQYVRGDVDWQAPERPEAVQTQAVAAGT